MGEDLVKDINKDFDSESPKVEKNVQSFLEWERDKYIFLGADKDGNKLFLCVNVVKSKYTVLLRLRISKRYKDGKWETLGTFYSDVWDLGKAVDKLEYVRAKALEFQVRL